MKGGMFDNAKVIKAMVEKKEREQRKVINLTQKEYPNPWKWMKDFYRG